MNARLVGTLGVLVLLIGGAVSAAAGEPGDELGALRSEMETFKENQLAIQRDLQEIKALLRRLMGGAGEPQNVVLRVEGHPSRGRADAKLTLIEFSDYQCPFCGRYVSETLPQIVRDYVEAGLIRYVFFNFPLEAIHKDAFRAAGAASCAGEQGRYWEMHDRIFAGQEALAAKDLAGHAGALGLDVAGFERCLESDRYGEAIRQDLAEGQKAGVRGTPSFFLGLAEPDGGVRAVKMITGAHPYAAFKEAIDSLLAAQKN